MKPKTINIIYWISTVLFALFVLSTCIPSEQGKEVITKVLGYPVYFITFIAVAKVCGAIAIVIPGFPRVKEWAYAGLIFDFISATYSFFAVGMLMDVVPFMVLAFALATISYVFYHKKLKAVPA